MFIYPYNGDSQSARLLATELGALRIRREGSSFRGSPFKTVINWGSSNIENPQVLACNLLNRPEAVSIASNKLSFFEKVSGIVSVPDYTTDTELAYEWLETSEVLGRMFLSSNSGKGIVFLSEDPNVVIAPLYTRYIPKKREFRVHVVRGSVLDVTEKKLRLYDDSGNSVDPAKVDFRIRNMRNGFVFARESVEAPEMVTQQALLAVKTVGLDFGAVDVIWNDKRQMAYVLEVNTAPGITGTTLLKYKEAFRSLL